MKSINKFKQVALSIMAVMALNTSYAQLTVSGAMTPTQWVQNVLVGTGVVVSNVTYTGALNASGTFNGTSSNVGFASGVLLTTGDILNAPGPNNNTAASTPNGLLGDPDLDAIIPAGSNDASILEFDFVSVSDSVKFSYVFASEEYMEFANGFINDGFGFFLSGPGITGPFSNNAINIALIPGTAIPVTIDNVNLINNSQYYFDNGDGSGTGTAPDGLTVQYDGFTVPLIAKSAVQCGQTYHIKIAIGDGSDDILDSGVFLKAGSFSSSAVQILPQISYGGPNDSVLYEGCGLACVNFVRTSNLSNSDTITVGIAGTAVNGVDYNTGAVGVPLPTQLIFLPGQDTITYCINAVNDAAIEGLETILFNITQTGPCAVTTSNATLFLTEHAPMVLTVMNDTTFCNTGAGGTLTLNTTVTGGVEPYTYSWTSGAPAVADPTVNVAVPTTFVLTVNDACSGVPTDPTPSVTDSIFVNVLNIPAVTITIAPQITPATATDSTLYEGCRTACVNFVRTSNPSVSDTLTITIGGTATNGTDYYYNTPGTPMPTQLIFPIGVTTITYCVNGAIDGATEGLENVTLSIFQSNPCITSTSNAHFNMNDLAPLTVTTSNDTTFCNQGGSATISALGAGGLQPYVYTWSNGLSSTTSHAVSVTATNTYTISVADACTGTPDPTPDATDVITLTVATFDPLVVTTGDDRIVCPGDVVTLSALVTGGGNPYIYNWSIISGVDTLTSYNTANTDVTAHIAGTYQVSVTDICNNTQNDQIAIEVETSCTLNIPNIITPNSQGDVVNETFYIENLDKFPAPSLVIYNRWGGKIYESDNYKNDFGGSKYSEGTYYYVLTVNSSGRILPNVKQASDIKTTESDNQKSFAGFFQITH